MKRFFVTRILTSLAVLLFRVAQGDVVFVQPHDYLASHPDAKDQIRVYDLSEENEVASLGNNDCPCDDPTLCLPLEQAAKLHPESPHVWEFWAKQDRFQVFAFVLKCDADVWQKFDWGRLSVVALAGFSDPQLVCHAHKHGVRVVSLANMPKEQLPDQDARARWVKLQASEISLKFMDGVNIDFEDDIADGSPEQAGLTALVRETSQMFHSLMPGSQVSVDVAWSPNGIDGRFYDYKAIADSADLIFVMAYDEMSQMWDPPCIARANSGLQLSAIGLGGYLKLGISPKKMILGVPWYGYNYPCQSFDEKTESCYLKSVPFRGCNCSDAAGGQNNYGIIMQTLRSNNVTRQWDPSSLSPYFSIKDPSTGQIRQLRYDDPQSLSYKYAYSLLLGLAGAGMWNANALDYASEDPIAQLQTKLMWEAFPV